MFSTFFNRAFFRHINCLTAVKIREKLYSQQETCMTTSAARYNVPGDIISGNTIKGIDHLRDPRLNKGLAFTLAERQAFGIHGLLSSEFRTLEQQLAISKLSVDRYYSLLNKYLYLNELQDTNETLFFRLINDDIEKFMPLINSPTLALACLRYGLVYKKARGLFITVHDRGHVRDVLMNWPERDIRVIVVTDGERVMGLGDLGAHAMGIPQAKIVLLTALAGVKPHQCMPVCLDCGTNNESLLEDPLYIGIRQKRCLKEQYNELLVEFMAACKSLYGPETLIIMEDFGLSNAHRLLNKFRYDHCTFNDDVQATAAAVVGGLMVACQRITKEKLSDNKYFFFGGGSAGVGIANLLCDAMVEEGLSKEDARARCLLFDKDGLITHQRDSPIPVHAKHYALNVDADIDFESCVKKFKPTALIGTSTVGNAFTPAVLTQMTFNAERPMIFALSNPTHQSECTAEDAYEYTNGRCIFASGSPFPPVKYYGNEYHTGQANNYYIYPGVALGVISAKACLVTNAMFLQAAKTLANSICSEDLQVGRIYPHISNMKSLSLSIACQIVSMAIEDRLTFLREKPEDIEKYIKDNLYTFQYTSHAPKFYEYPEMKSDIKVQDIEIFHKRILDESKQLVC